GTASTPPWSEAPVARIGAREDRRLRRRRADGRRRLVLGSGRGTRRRRGARQAEVRDRLVERRGLAVQLDGNRRHLLARRRVAARDLVDAPDRSVEERYTVALLARGRRHLLHQLAGLADRWDQLAELLTGPIRHLEAHGGEPVDVLSRFRTPL